jgi:hypothetical protein
MREKKEQISEEFADKLLEDYYFGDKPDFRLCMKEMKKRWKENGYIKQSREEEIREEIKNIEVNICTKDYFKVIKLQKELIEILDNKEKNK